MNDNVKIVILAAGKGKRMESEHPKALEEVGGKSMIEYVIQSAKDSAMGEVVVVLGHQAELVKSKLGDSTFYALQEEQLGTGNALLTAKGICADAERIVVLYA